MKKFLAVIPAREGSLGLKGKNFLKFNNKPLIYWTIKETLKSKYVDKIVLSSDSEKIKKYCKRFNRIEILDRPKKISKGSTTMFQLIKYILNFQIKEKFKYLIILQPTSPLRISIDIDNSCKSVIKNNFDSLVSIEEIPHKYLPQNIYRKKKIKLKSFKKKNILTNRQNIVKKNKFYARNGAAIYITKFKFLSKFILGGKLGSYLMPSWRSLDINNYFDFKVAEYVMKNKKILK